MDAYVGDVVLCAAIDGDERAMSALWNEWNPRLLRFFRARRFAEADDLAAVVWLEVAGKLPEFDGESLAFRRWLFTIAHRRLIDVARSASRTPAMVEFEASDHPTVVDVHDDVDWALELLQQLPENQATAVALRFLADLGVGDVAAIMGETAGNVRVLTHRGLRRLEAELRSRHEFLRVVVTGDQVVSLTPDT